MSLAPSFLRRQEPRSPRPERGAVSGVGASLVGAQQVTRAPTRDAPTAYNGTLTSPFRRFLKSSTSHWAASSGVMYFVITFGRTGVRGNGLLDLRSFLASPAIPLPPCTAAHNNNQYLHAPSPTPQLPPQLPASLTAASTSPVIPTMPPIVQPAIQRSRRLSIRWSDWYSSALSSATSVFNSARSALVA